VASATLPVTFGTQLRHFEFQGFRVTETISPDALPWVWSIRRVGQAIEWLCRVFGFTERLRVERDGVTYHGQLTVAEGAIMLGRQGGPYRAPPGTEVSAYVLVHVENVDADFAHAKESGAIIVHEPNELPFGERSYTARDRAGHWWTFSQHIADVPFEAWGAKAPDGSSQ
jgi:uncharacterized glyoxalase superfamily protein PhnB